MECFDIIYTKETVSEIENSLFYSGTLLQICLHDFQPFYFAFDTTSFVIILVTFYFYYYWFRRVQTV
jgi:hypothetical protein